MHKIAAVTLHGTSSSPPWASGSATVDPARLYRGLDHLFKQKKAIETHLRSRLGELFDLSFDILPYDLTSREAKLVTNGDTLVRLPLCILAQSFNYPPWRRSPWPPEVLMLSVQNVKNLSAAARIFFQVLKQPVNRVGRPSEQTTAKFVVATFRSGQFFQALELVRRRRPDVSRNNSIFWALHNDRSAWRNLTTASVREVTRIFS
jgi:hypothetical protein